MRDTEPLEPMWETNASPGVANKLFFGGAGLAAAALRLVAPQLFRYASGQQPSVRFSWGSKEYRLGREGLESRRRSENGWGDNPRSNYNDAVAKKQNRKSAKDDA